MAILGSWGEGKEAGQGPSAGGGEQAAEIPFQGGREVV